MGPTGFPETSVTNGQPTLRNMPEEKASTTRRRKPEISQIMNK